MSSILRRFKAGSEQTGIRPGYGPILLGFVLLICVIASYRFSFSGKISLEQDVWGQFGDYVGGVVNPLVGLITIWLLIRTLAVQRAELAASRAALKQSADALDRQADQFQNQSLKDDLFSRADVVFGEVTSMLEANHGGAPLQVAMVRHLDGGRTETVPIKAATLRQLLDRMCEGWPQREIVVGTGHHIIERGFRPIGTLLLELANYLDMIDELSGGNRASTNFYRRRVEHVASHLPALKVLDVAVFERLKSGEGI